MFKSKTWVGELCVFLIAEEAAICKIVVFGLVLVAHFS